MAKTTLRHERMFTEKYPAKQIENIAMEYFKVSHDQINSVSVSGRLRHARAVLFYFLYLYTDVKLPELVSRFSVPQNVFRQLIHQCEKQLHDKDAATILDHIYILSQLESSSDEKKMGVSS